MLGFRACNSNGEMPVLVFHSGPLLTRVFGRCEASIGALDEVLLLAVLLFRLTPLVPKRESWALHMEVEAKILRGAPSDV